MDDTHDVTSERQGSPRSSPFERIRQQTAEGGEYWSARDLAAILGYETSYRNFKRAIEKAQVACVNSGYEVDDHFADTRKMVTIGSGAQRSEDLPTPEDSIKHLQRRESERQREHIQPSLFPAASPTEDDTLRAILAQAPDDATALIAPESERQWSYGALRAQVAGLAESLAAMGIGRGDRVAMVLPNGPEIVAAFLAIVWGGAVAAPLNPAYKPDELAFYFDDIGPRALIVPPGSGAASLSAAARATAPADCRIIEISIGDDGRLTLAGSPTGAGSVAMPEPDDVALVLHTSGTTSRPKQVPLRHRNLLASARTIVQHYRLTPEDVSLCVMPLFHVHGLVASTLATLLSGGAVVAPTRFSAGRFWSDVRRHGVTWYSAVPTIHQTLLARASDPALAEAPPRGATGLRFARSCSSALAPATMQALEERLGMPVLEAYGMTEASHQMASNPLPPERREPGSVGRATGVEIAIMDAGGALLPAGGAGEVVIRGDSVTAGYHNNAEANAAAFSHGWFHTGDQGTLDAEGYLRLTGRLKEMILRGGENIAPREIDEVLLTHPAVAEAVVFGLPDDKYGEEVAAAVVLRGAATPEELMAHCRERIAEFKVPKTIFIADQIPRTATGKIQRRIVAAAFAGR